MIKTYYVDSENVGDSWIDLLKEDYESEFLIFYTDHSPRMDYEHAIVLRNVGKEVEFIRCYEGNNALDFQLVTYLGYQLRSDIPKEMIIVSNDTGFDAVVSFWKDRGLSISRLATKGTNTNNSKLEEMPVSTDEFAEHQVEEKIEKVHGIDRRELYTITNCMGKADTSNIHLACIHFYGNKKGEEIYKCMKAEKFSAPSVPWTRETKIKKFMELVFKYCNSDKVSVPNDLSSYLSSSVTSKDDKKTMKTKMNKKYGNKTESIHNILKPFYKAIAKIK